VAQTGKHGNSSANGRRVSPITLQKHLKGTNYPASKEDLVRRAQNNQAPDDILTMIRQLPNQSFESPAEVMRAFGRSQ
jgi:hypothetical protein